MKLIFCTICRDLVPLDYRLRKCSCERTGGRYDYDGDKIIIAGPCKVVGIKNTFFDGADLGDGDIFWYPESNGKVTRLDA